jgi:hypothetical protein
MENNSLICWCITSNAHHPGVPDLIAKLKMELTLQQSLAFAKTKYIKLQLDLILSN